MLRSADVKVDSACRGRRLGGRLFCDVLLAAGDGGLYNATPVLFRFFADETVVVVWIAKTQVVPTRTRPLRHDVGFACRSIGITNPVFCFGQWRLARPGRLVIFQGWRHDWQLGFS